MRLLGAATSAIVLILGFGSATLKADIPGVTIPNAPVDFGPSFWNLGFEFQANPADINITVAALGNLDFGSPSNLSQPQQVGLWSSSGVLLASAYITSSSTQIGEFAYTSITPLLLIAGDYYVVGGQGGAHYSGYAPITVAPQITYIEDRYTYIGAAADSPAIGPLGLAEPLTTEGLTSTSNAGWFGGSVLLDPPTATPEPSYYLVLGAAIAALMVMFRARRRAIA
jgi:hypothetical protein